MEQEIKIRAEFDRENIAVCKFVADRPLCAGKAVFKSKDQAEGNWLAEKLFQIQGVFEVSMYGPVVAITQSGGLDWKELGKIVGHAIRGYISAGMAPTEDEFRAGLPDPAAIREKVLQLLELQINPGVATHGGYVELIDVKDNNVYLRMGGGCQGCGMADVTLKQGIKALIRDEVPEVWEVLDVTDHAAGTNPYYQ